MYQVPFTGETKKVLINKDTGVVLGDREYHQLSILSWRNIALKHLPVDADITTAMFEFKCEYLHFNYRIPSRAVVPSSAIPTSDNLSDTDLIRQTRAIEFKNKYNDTNQYAFEFRLLEHYDTDYKLGDTNYSNEINYDRDLDYPLSDLIYNNRIPGFMDLIPYLINNGNLFFGDVNQEIVIQIMPRLENFDIITCKCGYSGSVTYEKKPIELILSKSETINISTIPTQILNNNNKRYGFYLCNNGVNNIYYSFNSLPGITSKLILKPQSTLIYENKTLSIDGSEIDYPDKRFVLGLPLWVKTTGGSGSVSIEEHSY